jgi:2'-5' RNA ligase
MKRIFLGIPIPHEIGKDLLQIFNQKNPLLIENSVRKLMVDQLHMTIHFFGNINPNQLLPLELKLKTYIDHVAIFENKIVEVTRFPSSHSNIVVAKVALSPELKKFHHDIQISINEVGLGVRNLAEFHGMRENPERSYRPHITLCRLKGENKSLLNEFTYLQSFSIRELVFYESKPTALGSQYIILQRFFLKENTNNR